MRSRARIPRSPPHVPAAVTSIAAASGPALGHFRAAGRPSEDAQTRELHALRL